MPGSGPAARQLPFLARSLGVGAAGLRRVLALQAPLARLGVRVEPLAWEWPWLERTRAASDAGDGRAGSALRALNRFRLLGPSRVLRGSLALRRLRRALRGADAVAVLREPPPPPWWDAVRASGLPVILDVDDAVWLQDAAGFDSLLRAAAMVVAGGGGIRAEMERRGVRVATVPTCAPRRASTLERPPDPGGVLRLLWLGSPSTLPYLAHVFGAIAAAAEERPLRLVVVGADGHALPRAPGVEVVSRPLVPYDPADHMADADVGLMPLPDGPWERCKCAAKIVDYMSAGLPTVASPVGANADLLRGGRAGILAEGDAAWTEAIDRLARSADLRRRLGEEALRVHAAEYDLDGAARRWVEVLDLVRRGHRPAPARAAAARAGGG